MTTRGARLSAFLLLRTGGRRGWQATLVRGSGVKRQTITKWTKADFDGYPEPEHLAALAAAVGAKLWEVVAVMDGDVAVSMADPQLRQVIRAEVEAALDERLGPRREPREGSDAA